MKSKANNTLNRAGTKVHKFFKHHENTVLTRIDREKPDFIKNASNGIKLKKKENITDYDIVRIQSQRMYDSWLQSIIEETRGGK